MPWKETTKMDQRKELVRRYLRGESMSALAREYGVSRKTGYKVVRRVAQQGEAGFMDRVSRPGRCPHKTDAQVVEAIVSLKKKYGWGAKKIKALMPQEYPGVRVPSRTTIHTVLRQQGLVKKQRRRRRVVGASSTLTQPTHANHVWCTDFKGQFRLDKGQGSYCYPLTTTDAFSRFIVGCEALSSTCVDSSIEAFLQLFGDYGLPQVIRSDNGVPFASSGQWGLSRLSVLWMALGIVVERIAPGKPHQNGAHERMHRTLKKETTRPSAQSLLKQQQRFDEFVRRFNHKRPHESLDMQTPSQRYTPSDNKLPKTLPTLHYPLHDFTRKVGPDGRFYLYKRHIIGLTQALSGYDVGLRELDEGNWLVSFANLDLGLYCPSQRQFKPQNPYG